MLKADSRLVTFFVLLGSIPVFAQVQTFRWHDPQCYYQGSYEAKKYTRKQLENTAKLIDGSDFRIDTPATVFKPEDITDLNLGQLEREYKKELAALAGLEIVRVSYWENERARKIAELKQVYDLSQLAIQGYSTPTILGQLTGSDVCKTKYAAPLGTGGDLLFDAWRTLNEESRAENSDPERVRRTYEQQNQSVDRQKYAVVELITFGWWNCANKAINYVEYDGSQGREYKKLFTKVKKLSCDGP